ncbi:serine hydrolase domain-containing protein [Isoptericola haloaureus]|uniref:Serine hydrolase domain-containing protein n=1 Tax=Isoptericola haloaureus TaxID=1542902 RepID=A0ABU7Z509_9MICO
MSGADLLRETAAQDIALHTVQVLRGDELAVDVACTPVTVDTPRRMYSVAKTVTGLAVGLLAAEDRVDLDDPVLRHFPEMAPVHPWVEATTLRDVLAMRGPHRATTYQRSAGPWVESYFRVPPTHRPGTVFTYDTSGSHVLAALVERTAGTSLVEYLRPRLLDPLGVSGAFRFLTDPQGVAQGGSGLVCTAADLLRLARLLRDGGTHAGTELLPPELVRQATAWHTDTTVQPWGDRLRGGYGLQLWLPRGGGALMFGMGGQLALADPARDLAMVVTADSQACPGGDRWLIDRLLGSLDDLEPPKTGPLSWPAPRHEDGHARPVTGSWELEPPEAPPVRLELDVDAAGGRLRWVTATADTELSLRCDGLVTSGPQHPARTGLSTVTAGWSAPGTLGVRLAVVGDEVATVALRVVVADDGTPTVQSQGFGEAVDPSWTVVATGRPVPDQPRWR